jgi:hypothetical protein
MRNVNVQLFDVPEGPFTTPPLNRGFVFDYAQQPCNTLQKAHNIMRCFAPNTLPVLTTLAQEFAICDHWFASVPGPTWPNRFFVHTATSDGHVDNQLRDYEMRTIYDNLKDAGVLWRIYFHDIPQALALARLRRSILKKGFQLFADFLTDARNAQLPGYSFIEPRYFDFFGMKANDQHPPHDVSLGELLIAGSMKRCGTRRYGNRVCSSFCPMNTGASTITSHLRVPSTPMGRTPQIRSFSSIGSAHVFQPSSCRPTFQKAPLTTKIMITLLCWRQSKRRSTFQTF